MGYLLLVTHGNRKRWPVDDSPLLYQPHMHTQRMDVHTVNCNTHTHTHSLFHYFKCRFSTLPQLQCPIRMHTLICTRTPHEGRGMTAVVVGRGCQDDSHINDKAPPPPPVSITPRQRTYHLDSTHILSTSWGTSQQAGSRKLWRGVLLSQLMGTQTLSSPLQLRL